MIIDDKDTQQRILQFAKEEFLEKGFQNASLRNIVKRAGVTTGAFYGYYADKNALFDDLVSKPANQLKNYFLSVHDDFDQKSALYKVENMHTYSRKKLKSMIDYIFQNFDAFRLIICCAQGTNYDNYIDCLVAIESEYTHRFFNAIKETECNIKPILPDVVHILGNAYFSAVFEIVVHNMPKDTAEQYIDSITDFFYAGWDKIMGC